MIDNALLWAAQYDTGNISYIFGTMHVRDQAAYSFANEVLPYLDACTHYYGEMDLNEAAGAIRVEDYLMPGGQKLSGLLPEAAFNRMRRDCLRILGQDIMMYDRLYPIITLNQLSESILAEDQPVALDQFLWSQAEEKGLEMGGVESVAHQVEILHMMALEEQVRLLAKATRTLKTFRKGILRLKLLYENHKILRLYCETRKSLGAFRHTLLFERNKKMSERIHGLSHEKAFFAIGAAHLAGFHGVLRSLKNSGVNIWPVY